jgi:glutamate--cysteine ligase
LLAGLSHARYGRSMTTHLDSKAASPIIESRDQLIASFARGEKPPEKWRIGTEHEKFVYALGDHHAPSYDERGGIRDLLMALTEFGWTPVEEIGPDGTRNVIALTGVDGSVSLEPAGQFELSDAPLENLHQTCAETGRHLEQVKAVGDKFGIGFLGLGMWPDKTRSELPVMPKGRYVIMRSHMPRVGSMGLDMMLRTCTIQVNLDYRSEADMVKKFRVGLALQPLATALFANSPFLEGKPNGMLSYRSHIWSDTDPARTGMLPFVFEDGFGYERYAEYALDVPMYFVYRDGKYIDAAGLSFRDFIKGELSVVPGEKPTLDDWNDHLSTAFPEVRLKTFLEMRGADGGPWSRICALPALWVGLLYDQGALDAAWDLVRHWTIEERQALRDAVPKLALDAPIPGGGRLRDIAGAVVDIASAGLTARARLDASGSNETGFLDPLREIVRTGKVPAEVLLERYHGAWGGDVSKVYDELRF